MDLCGEKALLDEFERMEKELKEYVQRWRGKRG